MKRLFLLLMLVIGMMFCYGCSTNISKVIIDNYENELSLDNNLYTICFRDKDGTILSNKVLRHNDLITLPDDPIVEATAKYYYTFIGWDYNNDQIVDEIPNQATYSFIATAVYEYILRSYTVEFRLDTVNYEGKLMQEVKYGNAADVPNNLVKQGYRFVGWDNAFDYITGHTIISAIWEIETYQLTLDAGSNMKFAGLYQTSTVTVLGTYSDNLPLPVIISTPFSYFKGYANKDGVMVTDCMGTFIEPYRFTSDETFTAMYDLYTYEGVYQMGYYPNKLITDTELIADLYQYVTTTGVESKYFYYERTLYYLENNIDATFDETHNLEHYFFTAELVDFIYVGEVTTAYVDPNQVGYGGLISKDVLYYDTYNNFNQIKGAFNEYFYGFEKTITLPFLYIEHLTRAIPFLLDYTEQDYQFAELDEESKFASNDYAKSLGYDGSDYFVDRVNTSRTNSYYLNTNHDIYDVDEEKHGIKFMITVKVRN